MEPYAHTWRRSRLLLLGLAVAIALLALFTNLLYAQEQDGVEPQDRDYGIRMPTEGILQGAKYVDKATAPAGGQLHYTLVISNSGESNLTSVLVTDTLSAGLTFVEGSVVAPAGTIYDVTGNVLTWSGALIASSEVTLDYKVVIDDALDAGETVGNEAVVTADGQTLMLTTTTTVAEGQETIVYMPLISKTPPKATASATLPNSQGQWTLNWTFDDANVSAMTGVQVHESQSPDFASYETHNLAASARSLAIQHAGSPNNVYYYRVVPIGSWGAAAYSNVVTVIGNYYDDFSNPNTGWSLRRASLLEKMHAYYSVEGGVDVFIALVDDRWDWLLASPLRPAPAVPYAIEYRARVHDASNLVSGGIVYGGNWNGGACPEQGNLFFTGGNCFSQFYTHNYIFYGPLKLQWEKVEQLVYCPDCGGSALKRVGPTDVHDNIISLGPSVEWHTYRVEVRGDGVSLFIDGAFRGHFGDTSFVERPYFGVFASTFEYKPAIWFFDYYRVTRLD